VQASDIDDSLIGLEDANDSSKFAATARHGSSPPSNLTSSRSLVEILGQLHHEFGPVEKIEKRVIVEI